MLDTQFAGKMTGLPGGLSAAIARQLERQMGCRARRPWARLSAGEPLRR
jgi:flagellar protein FlgJ